VVWLWRLFATTGKRRQLCFSQNQGINPELQQALQPVHAHQLYECGWRWTRRLVMALLRNQTKRKEIIFSKQNQ
jgi:hypothetical protein